MIDTEYDLGFITSPVKGKAIKATLNNFRGKWYFHIREYIEDPDENIWYPTSKGISLDSDYIGILSYSVEQADRLHKEIFYNNINKITEKQLELFNEV